MTSGSTTWTANVLTLFPEMFPGPLGQSLAGKALDKGLWAMETVDIRDFTSDKHQIVDDTPFGGGPGMVMRPDVIDLALNYVQSRRVRSETKEDAYIPVIYLTPRGRPLDQSRVQELAAGKGITVVCGRYEGIDERVVEAWEMEEISLGDFVLSGGEPAATALIDACVRLLPGVMGADESRDEESFKTGLLEYPHYTRPRVWRDRNVPEVLLSGHHANVAAWRQSQAEKITRERRPDLWTRYAATRAIPDGRESPCDSKP